MSDDEGDVCGFHGGDNACRLRQIAGHRLFANDVDAVACEGVDGGCVQRIGCEDRHGFDAVRPRGFGFCHINEGAIRAIRRNACSGGGRIGALFR